MNSFFQVLKFYQKEGYLAIASASFAKQKLSDRQADDNESEDAQTTDNKIDENTIEKLKQLKKGMEIDLFLRNKRREKRLHQNAVFGFHDTSNGKCGPAYR